MHGDAVALGVIVGDRRMHLHLVLAHFRAVVDAFAHQIGFGESRIDVAELEKDIALDVVRAMLVQIDGAGRHRGLCGVISRQFADFQLDALERLLGGGVVDRRDSGDRFAAVTHALARQRIFGARNRQDAEAFVAIGAGHDGLHARQLLGFRHIDVENLSMRIGAAENAPGQHVQSDKIGGVFGATGNLFRAVHQRHIVADRLRRHDLVHGRVSVVRRCSRRRPRCRIDERGRKLTAKHPPHAGRLRISPPR